LLACSASAFAQTVGIHVRNIDDQDLYVSLSDQNASGNGISLGRLDQGSPAVDVPITADGHGYGSVAWRVVSTRTPAQAMCGGASGLGSGSEVDVDTSGQGVSPY
jgi:hypothetical protein